MKAPTVVASAPLLLSLVLEQLQARTDGFVVPDARYVAPGADVAFDQPALVVHLAEIGQGNPGAPFGGTYQPASVTNLFCTFDVLLIREVPGLQGDYDLGTMLPDPDLLTQVALQTINDAEALVQALVAIHAAYTFTGPGEGFVINPVTQLGPQGLFVGTVAPLIVSVT